MKNGKTGLSHFFAAFGYSISGFKYAFDEMAFRQELMLGGVHVLLLCLLDVHVLLAVVVSVLFALLLVVELINTAIETVVDLVSPEYNVLAKKAKDVSSAAEAVALLTYLVSWIVAVMI